MLVVVLQQVMREMSKIIVSPRMLWLSFIVILFSYLYIFKERIAYSPKFVVGDLIEYSCGNGRAKGRLDLVINQFGERKEITTNLFGYREGGWIQCNELGLSKKIGARVVFGETSVSWGYLKIGGEEIHSLRNLINQVDSDISTKWEADLDVTKIKVPK